MYVNKFQNSEMPDSDAKKLFLESQKDRSQKFKLHTYFSDVK